MSISPSIACAQLAPGLWALHVPLGKLNTERLVPIDDSVCQLVHRLRFFRFISAVPPDGLLLARRHNRSALLRELRTELTQVRTTLGIARPLVPHMFRHTFATEMLRSGVSFPALMKLLGHSSPEMTMLYAEFTQTDLQREFRAARSQPRHLLPPPRAATTTSIGLNRPISPAPFMHSKSLSMCWKCFGARCPTLTAIRCSYSIA